MKSKRIFTILGIVLTTLTLILGTYAYWLWSSNDNTSLAATIGELAQVSFITGDSITVTDMAPVLNYNDGETVSFVARNNSDVNLGLYVDLEITQISTALQVEDFKWVFLTSLDEENYEIAESGTFLDQGTGTVTIAEGLEVNSKTRLYCKFIVYIDGSKQNSNDMMNKTFKANLNALMDTTDKVAPTLTVTTPASSTSSSPSYASSTSYSVTGTSVDEVSGINAVYIKVGDGEYQSFSVTEDGNYDGVVTLQEGLNTISIYSEDKSFNSTEVITRYVYYDTSGPTLTVTAPTGTSETSPTYTSASSYEVRGTTSDSESGISGVTVNDEAATVSGTNYNKTVTLVAGINTITVVSTNQAGLTATLTRYVYYDDTNPSLTVTNPEGTSESSPTYSTSTSYTVSGTASDSESGLKTVTVNGEAASVSGSNYSKAITLSSG